jgi:hypothetical protein
MKIIVHETKILIVANDFDEAVGGISVEIPRDSTAGKLIVAHGISKLPVWSYDLLQNMLDSGGGVWNGMTDQPLRPRSCYE